MHERIENGVRKAGDTVATLGFLALIAFVPLRTFTAAERKDEIDREFRRPAPAPTKPQSARELREWPAKFDAWYRDHFALRTKFIRWHNLAKLGLFELSPTSEIVVGPEHWMFTTRDNAVEVFRGADPFSQRELDLWVRVLEDRREWCRQRGIAYLFAIATNKESVYPEMFPARFDKIGPTRREQLVEHVRARSDFPLLDLTDAMRASRRDNERTGPVYFPLGTHWNERGALDAYYALMQRVAELVPRVQLRPRSDFSFRPTDYQDDSWAGRLYLEDRLVQHNDEVVFASAIPREFWDKNLKALSVDTAHPDASLPRAVVFHDSMGEKLRPLIAEHFSRTSFRWVVSDFDTAVLESEKPDIVIQVFVERALAATSLSNSPLDTNEVLEREFAASSQVLLPSSQALRPGALAAQNTGARTVSFAEREDGALSIDFADGRIQLPELAVPDRTWAVVRFDLEAPAPAAVVIEFLTQKFRTYSTLGRSFKRPLPAGRSVVYAKLRVPDLAGRVQFHFGGANGEYVLHSLEVRAVPE